VTRAARNQKRYQDRLNAEIIVVRLPIVRDELLDLVHAAGIVVPDPARETLESCFSEFVRLFEAGELSITRRWNAMRRDTLPGIGDVRNRESRPAFAPS
jgi:hypothetical protein